MPVTRKLLDRLTYANVVATLALFVALGGSSYATIQFTGRNVKDRSLTAKDIKKNSLTTSEVKNRSLLAQDFKAGQLPSGAQGAPGPQGAKGDRGDPGPTSANSTTDTLSGASFSHVAATTTVNMPTAGKLFGYGREFVEFTCTADGHCGGDAALFLDGNYVHGSFTQAVGDNSQFVGTSLATSAIAPSVSAGPHVLELRTALGGSNTASFIEFGNPQVGGVALGG